MCTDSKYPSVPLANSLTILSADLLAIAATNLLQQLACSQWEPAQRLRQALSAYTEVRTGNAIRDAEDPQDCQLNPSRCEHCKHGGKCDQVPSEEFDCFEPATQRSEARHA